jgi:hypothetical protein
MSFVFLLAFFFVHARVWSCAVVCPVGVTRRDPEPGIPQRPAAQREAVAADGVGAAAPGTAATAAGGASDHGVGFFPSLFALQFQHFMRQSQSQPDGLMSTEDRHAKLLSRLMWGAGGVVLVALVVL